MKKKSKKIIVLFMTICLLALNAFVVEAADKVNGFPLPTTRTYYVTALSKYSSGATHDSYLYTYGPLKNNTYDPYVVADIAADSGTPIYAVADGKIITNTYGSGGGNYLVISHYDGTYSYYGHMANKSSYAVGSTVNAGDIVGYVGKTGLATGYHLHFEWSWHDPFCEFKNLGYVTIAPNSGASAYPHDHPTPTPISAGKTSIPVVKLSGKNVTVEWDYSGNATSFDVYLLQEPCGWEDIKYRSLNHSASERSYTFSDVAEGAYYAFVIARPNADDVQSGWSPFKVVNNGVALNYWGEDVKRLQETLNGMTGTKLGTDGWYGPNTEKAVKAYQKEKGLTADGWYGASTKAALEGEVKTMQNMLNAVTGTSLGADGWFGPNTQKAVKAYQQKKGLTVNGWYDGSTKSALEADYNALTSPASTTSVTSPDPTVAPISTPIETVEIPEQPSIGENTPDTVNKDNESSSVLTVYGGDTLQIAVDNKMADFGDAQPFIDTNSRTQVPIRAVSELLNCTVGWDPVTRSATITGANGDTIVIAIGSVEMTVNGSKVTMDTAALIANDRTYIPLRCVAEAFGLKVDWI